MENKTFIGYEYKEVHTDTSKVHLLTEGYECFGWEQIEIREGGPTKTPRVSQVYMKMRRDRKIINKMELTRLQRHFEACVQELDKLEDAKKSRATITAIIIGIIGTAFMAGAVLAITATQPKIVLCILFAIPAFIGWTLPYFVHKKIETQDTEKYAPFIEAKYDEIYELCEKGTKLLH